MTDTQPIQIPDRKGLREFALLVGGVIAVLFGAILPWLVFDVGIPTWPWLIGGSLMLWGLIAPATLGPVYVVWMRFGLLLHRIVSPIVLGITFFLVITPMAAVMKIIRRDTMHRSFEPGANSYRRPSAAPSSKNMERPF